MGLMWLPEVLNIRLHKTVLCIQLDFIEFSVNKRTLNSSSHSCTSDYLWASKWFRLVERTYSCSAKPRLWVFPHVEQTNSTSPETMGVIVVIVLPQRTEYKKFLVGPHNVWAYSVQFPDSFQNYLWTPKMTKINSKLVWKYHGNDHQNDTVAHKQVYLPNVSVCNIERIPLQPIRYNTACSSVHLRNLIFIICPQESASRTIG